MEVIKYQGTANILDVAVKVATVLKKGGVVIYPTETTYGIAAAALSPKAVRKIYAIKGRAFNKPLSVMVNGLAMAEKYVEITEAAKNIFATLLPGPLTLILKKKKIVPDSLTGGSATLGLRWPAYPLVQRLLDEYGLPITATSANPAGEPPLYEVSNITEKFGAVPLSLIDLVIDAGPLPHQLPSTVLDLTINPPTILREGPVSSERITAVLGCSIK
ncbi:MAG: L-threonylcarbamoyladenylate synthase [Patescibacteria group bacterium]